jgi:hypothetical protein
MNASKALIIAALCCFGLSALGIGFDHLAFVPLGLACFMASKLVK